MVDHNDYYRAIAYMALFTDEALTLSLKYTKKKVASRQIKECLKKMNISSAEKKIGWFIHNGFRSRYHELDLYFRTITEQERDEYFQIIPETQLHQASFVRSHLYSLPGHTVAAFDYSLAMLLTQYTLDKKRISRSEAFSYQKQIVELVQQGFASWEEYIKSFLVGYCFHFEISQKEHSRLVKGFTRLLSSPSSPLHTLPFHSSLSLV
ncbi:hypothetical protein A374_14220 [Fictibacillus macauensis ZFHKF-1]|uniref:DUF1266 domain-containing protein n=1 Tax=Fictibacillus macauensis ZFHKF-1 TaxID=1196324 RepID=I8AHD3_9BACL|nr:DUF1266 domain-containing protein [Fictibacillus macauensis]EIT84854.1 hypothetical protein A374_14220 [Fictibacillus macauensis ZFHKF-1]